MLARAARGESSPPAPVSPLPPHAQRVAGSEASEARSRGRGWGGASAYSSAWVPAEPPPTPDPSPPLRGWEGRRTHLSRGEKAESKQAAPSYTIALPGKR